MTISTPYQGDLLKTIGPDGSSVTFTGGDPVRDVTNIQNAILYSLFVEDWFANAFTTNVNQQLTGTFLQETSKSITKVQLLNIQDAAEKDLAWLVKNGTLKAIEVTVDVDTSNNGLIITIMTTAPDETTDTFDIVRTSAGWSV